jgi:orotidine-5'-phosphate decarboxylase
MPATDKAKPAREQWEAAMPATAAANPANDQKRVVTVEAAYASGADHIVIGRPIRDAADPRAAAEAIQASIARQMAGPQAAR